MPSDEMGFNPRTHTGCDSGDDPHPRRVLGVSIHAPTRGATDCIKQSFHLARICFNPRTHTGCDPEAGTLRLATLHVSIHAPTRGATLWRKVIAHTLMMFQSTHPHGVRLGAPPRCRWPRIVSIHAPTRGATAFSVIIPPMPSSFNPRTHTGCD